MKSPENCHKLIINEEYAPNVRRIFDLYLEGKSSIQIAYIFNEEHIPTPSQTMGQEYRLSSLWKTDTIRRILKMKCILEIWYRANKHKSITN